LTRHSRRSDLQNYRDDAILTTAANNALALNVTVPDGVEATARDGNLTLTGAVEYGQQRKAAELAVAGLAGVRNVKDDIDISYDADPIDATWFVQDALDRNALIDDDSDVSVDTSGNTVTLPISGSGCGRVPTAKGKAKESPPRRRPADRIPSISFRQTGCVSRSAKHFADHGWAANPTPTPIAR
jgi:hypothetical protein